MSTHVGKLRVLFLCTGNSCRSQMAEGLTRQLKADLIDAYSAGVEPQELDARAVKVMAEVGVDISRQRAKHIRDLGRVNFDYVITVCDNARERCPYFAGGVKSLHMGFEDPPFLARNAKTEEEALTFYRRVRDEIIDFVQQLPEILEKGIIP
jgi:arsenate reductase (thioredoxin)